jgi:hypothetical protein
LTRCLHVSGYNSRIIGNDPSGAVAERPVALPPEKGREPHVAVPIRSFVGPGAFGPEALAAMGEAYEAALASRPTVVREAIARRIIAAARFGERDPIRLRAAGLAGPQGDRN